MMFISCAVQNSFASPNVHRCLMIELPAASLLPRIANLWRSSNFGNRASKSLSGGLSGFCSRSRSPFASTTRVRGRLENRVSSSIFFSRFSVAVRASMEAAASGDTKDLKEEVPNLDPIIQYIVIRKDLVDTMKWPLGSVISQGCHAAVAAIWLHKDDSVTSEYCAGENLDNMHKVTLEVKGETQLRNLAQKLEIGGVAHKLWMEQPENFPTCLATKPYRKSEVASFFKSLKLCR
uniref:peptidyl-tRNA hydrolase n=1 Tax=Physcomitrium patens TaxID=3218 RepID=A0A2K1IZU9_PHYPA|nr:hypothetical protein PHYPA_022694 [Physcomitrium patens]